MSYFTSKREKRLWLWLAAALVAIFTTLGFAGSLAREIGESVLGVGLFILCCLLVLAMVITNGLSRKPGKAEIGLALGLAAVYIMIFVRMRSPIERSHLFEYAVVALLIHEALKERRSQGAEISSPSIIAILAATFVGVLDESVQAFVPQRVFDPIDMLFNALAAFMAVVGSELLSWARHRFNKS
ncbi:VanZ family protein [Zeaxanthinibacter sp. PT1]|uniref:VanZ family protein n=1 Tax=Zeaxanthinibacter TaxID=561554 RepID=UPI00234991F3|nr:VanZ family protein [Zeaxanthinibacter sp. PT1]MDC6350948.1 VanZ family protein [Zeaxanthinibacter sp. PT1]